MKEKILLMLALMVVCVISGPVIGIVVMNIVYGPNVPQHPEFIKVADDVCIYVLGIISGYILNKTPEKP